jgi:hypothetical protein
MGEPPRSRSGALAARNYLPGIVALLLVAGLLTVVFGARSATAPAAAAAKCDPAAVMNQRLDELGRGGYTWTIAPDPLDEERDLGVTWYDRPEVDISDKATRALMPMVVNHEWMHVLQARAFPDDVERAFGGHDDDLSSAQWLLDRAHLIR